MSDISEMDLYSQLFEDVKYKYQSIEDYAWGEELIDYKLIVYKNDKSTIPQYSKITQNVIKVGLITINKNAAGMIVVVNALYDTSTEKVYIKEKDINLFWKYLRRSIIIGMNNHPDVCAARNITRPEDILDLSYYHKGKREVFVNSKGYIQYKADSSSQENLAFRAARQSAMDNPNITYVYAASGGLIHDKLCKEIANISDEDFRASAEFPEGGIWCPKCRRTNIIRKGCSPHAKQIPICNHIFMKNNVSLSLVERMIQEGCKFYASNPNCLEISGIEDNWEIHFFEDKVTLWHNNYVKTSDTERYITDGFHNQRFKSKNVNQMLYYIFNYTWEKHLEGEKYKKAQEEAKILTEQQTLEATTKKSILRRIVDYIKSVWK